MQLGFKNCFKVIEMKMDYDHVVSAKNRI